MLSHNEGHFFFLLKKELVPLHILPARNGIVSSTKSSSLPLASYRPVSCREPQRTQGMQEKAAIRRYHLIKRERAGPVSLFNDLWGWGEAAIPSLVPNCLELGWGDRSCPFPQLPGQELEEKHLKHISSPAFLLTRSCPPLRMVSLSLQHCQAFCPLWRARQHPPSHGSGGGW